MSSDNFYYVKGREVYMGFASDIDSHWSEKKQRKFILKGRPIHHAETHEEAVDWAFNEYAEYGVWGIEP